MPVHDIRNSGPLTRSALYPAPAVFAVSCLVGTLATDLAYWRTADMMWADFSAWLVTVGVVVGWLALVVGVIEIIARRSSYWQRPRLPSAIGYVVALILATLNMLVHTRDAWTSVVPWGLALSGATVLVVLIAGWLARARSGLDKAEVTA